MKKKIILDGIETNYSVTDDGRVFNDTRGTELKGTTRRNEYRSVQLTVNKQLKTLMVHRLVAQAFCENPNNYDIVDHIDKDKMNNKASNLRWVSQKENVQNSSSGRRGCVQLKSLKDFDETKWKQIKCTFYYINDQGQVFNKKTGKLLTGSTRNGYKRVDVGSGKQSVHRLVWEAYKGTIPDGMIIDHIDGDRSNNKLDNLRCISQSQNAKASYEKNRAGIIKVIQLDKNLQEIQRFPSIQAAADAMGVTHAAVRSAINREGTCKGYFWKKVTE